MNATDIAAKSDTAAVQQPGFFEKLSNGEADFPIVDHRRRWYAVLVGVLAVCILAILIRGFSLGIDFVGGTRMGMPPAGGATESHVAEVFEDATGVSPQSTQTVGTGDAQTIEINSERLSEEQIASARDALFKEFQPTNSEGQATDSVISDSTVSESWGSSITNRMLVALAVFLAAVFLYIALRLERDMALAAVACLLIDLSVVSGLYALIGFEVSPATVIGLLTILAYSLYDTVVVFDKVRENSAGLLSSTRRTYAEQVNLAVNQTIMRSINTSIISLVPIASLLVVAVGIMGVGTLKDLALVQFIGVIAGTFSSVLFAAPLLVTLKLRQSTYKQHTARVIQARQNDEPAVIGDSDEPAPSEGSEEEEMTSTASGMRKVVSPNANKGGQSWRPGL